MNPAFRYIKNVRSPHLEETFILQLGEYANELFRSFRQAIRRRGSARTRAGRMIGWRICKCAFECHRLRCQLLEIVAERLACQNIDHELGLTIMQTTATVLQLLAQPASTVIREGLQRAFDWLTMISKTAPERVVVCHSCEWESLSPWDYVGWLLVERRGHPMLTWNFAPLVPRRNRPVSKNKGELRQDSRFIPSPSGKRARKSAIV